ncbi:hypothetical protein FRC08_014397 [Ceratobasidium sp. 394]|nr:hypothetical protein FRC08_014397 [Ceratobasidium sp. 394]
MPPVKRSKYALNLQAIADQQAKVQRAQRKKHQLNKDEAARKRVSASVRTDNHEDEFQDEEILPMASGSRESQPRPSSTLSQNVNGSEQQGRRAREDFVTETLNTATTSGSKHGKAVAQEDVTQNAQQNPAASDGAQGKSADHETVNPQPPVVEEPQPEDEDINMSETDDDEHESQADTESEAGNESETDNESGTDNESEAGEMDDATFLKMFEELYKRRPTKDMKNALFHMLEKLSKDAGTRQGSKRAKQGSNSRPEWVQDKDYTCTDGPRRRSVTRVALSGYVRVVIDELLKVKDKNRLPPGPPPEVAAPTAAAFYFRWDESEKSEFNAIAARVVALRVIKEWPSLSDVDEIFDMATTHFKYLRACYRRQTVPEVAAKEPHRHRAANANTRKHTLYKHQLHIIRTIPALAKHGQLIEKLGIEGTSSDEEGPRSGVYLVRRKKQLSSKVQHLKLS